MLYMFLPVREASRFFIIQTGNTARICETCDGTETGMMVVMTNSDDVCDDGSKEAFLCYIGFDNDRAHYLL